MRYRVGIPAAYGVAMPGQTPWTDGKLRAAWAARDWPIVFTRYRKLTGDTQTALGIKVDLTQGAVSLIEHGQRKVSHDDVITRIAEGLSVPSELLGLSEPGDIAWSPDPELRERVAHAQRSGKTDIRAAEWIATVLREHRKAEDDVGGRDLWAVVASQLDTVTSLLPGSSGATADRLLLLAAEHAHWLSWVAYSEGKRGAALQWLDTAHGWGIDAGSADMRLWVERVRSNYGLRHGEAPRALRTAEMAREATGRVSPASASILAHSAAMAAAAAGDRDKSRRLSDEAYTLALQVPDESQRPAWLYFLDPVRAKLQVGDRAYASRDYATAAAAFREGLGELTGFPKDAAYYALRLEDSRARS